jgi:hypothetical protein
MDFSYLVLNANLSYSKNMIEKTQKSDISYIVVENKPYSNLIQAFTFSDCILDVKKSGREVKAIHLHINCMQN